MRPGSTFAKLMTNVIEPGLCTHCGTCVGLSTGSLAFRATAEGPLPIETSTSEALLPALAYEACPGKGLHYPTLNQFVFGQLPDSWLVGNVRQAYLAYALDESVRRNAASGGVLSQTILYLLEKGKVCAGVMLQQGEPQPWKASPVLARTRPEVLAAAQSVYVPSPMNTILSEMQTAEGPVAYVGLPDQVASLRSLQCKALPAAEKAAYVFGPYVGTCMYLGAIESFLHSHGVAGLEQIDWLRYREGEWPGELQIRTRDGRLLRARKFYYNYLIPFYITRSSLYSVDFTNELTDFSVGDAWRPDLESQGQGYSVVLARTEKGSELLKKMQAGGWLHLEPISMQEALSMHGHMLDFKKRGGFLRIQRRARRGKKTPHYGYAPASIPADRKITEFVISGLFGIGASPVVRWVIPRIPLRLLGTVFDLLRRAWKSISKPSKRKGLYKTEFIVDEIVHP